MTFAELHICSAPLMAPLTAMCLEDYRIQNLPSSAFYVSDFISPAEEQVLLDKVCHDSMLVIYAAYPVRL